MGKKKPIISPFGQWAHPGEVTIIPSSDITMKGVNYPVLGIDDLGNQQMMMPGQDYTFPGNYVTEYPQMGKGGQMIKRKDGSYSQRGLWDNIRANKGSGKKPTKQMLEQERKIKAKMKNGGWLDQFDVGGEKSFWDKYKYLPSSKSPNTYEKVNVDKDHYAFNSPLGNKGDSKVQQYQKWLNENFNTYLDEDGIWGEKTENAYKKYVLEKQKPNIPNTDPGLLNNYDSKLSFKYDDKGNLQVKSGNKYEEDYQDWTNVEKLSPTLKEFKSLVDKIPSYNQYYEDVYDADPSLRGNQAGPVTQTRASQIENTKKYKPISDKNKEYIGKTFGTLPVVEASGIYEGYSPNRIWTTPPATDSKPWLGDNEKYDPEKNPRYLYFITPKEGTKSADKKFTEQLEDLNCASGVCGDEYLNKSKTTYFDDISNQRFKKALKVKETIPGPTGETWKLGQQAYIEMLNNPEIIEYAKQKNIDLKNLSPKEAYSPLLAEALVANRDARFNNKDVVIPDSRYYSTVIQNPDAFNLAGYLPITLDMFSPNTDIQAQQKLLLNWDKASRESYLEKAGIPKDKWDDVYIHTSSFPIEEYTPGKKYGGWLSKYQSGGLSMGDYDLTAAPKRGDYLLPDINRPSYIDEVGNKRSEYRMGKNIDGKETLIPTVVGGKQLSEDEALDRYYKTGLHMGQFNTPEEADYASRLRTARYNMLEDPIRFQADQFQVGGRAPIYTSNPNDPRLRSYNDSTRLYEQSKYLRNLNSVVGNRVFTPYKNWKPWVYDPIDLKKRNALTKQSILQSQAQELSDYNHIANVIKKRHSTIKPESILTLMDDGSYWPNRQPVPEFVGPVYKKPVQPILYKKPVPKPVYKKPEVVPVPVVETVPPVSPIIEQPIKKVGYTQPIIQQFNYMSNENKAKALQKYGSVSDIPFQGVDINQLKDGGWLDEFQVGGGRRPIYTSNPRDPRLRRYNDSLNLYNKGELNYKKRLAFNKANNIPTSSIRKWNDPIEFKGGFLTSIQPIEGNGYFYNYNPDVVARTNVPSSLTDNQGFRYKKPVQPYIYKKPKPIPEVLEFPSVSVPSAPVPVVEPPKPSLFVSNIDRDMYTPGGGMGREYNIGVTLQDGSKKAFRTEKEYQDWKAANNLDISNAKVTEGKGYSYDYPENKKYGGWLDQFQTGGWAGWTPNVGKPYLRTSPAGNAGYSDNTKVVTQNTNVSAANRKAAEAAEYAKRVGSISQGKTKSDYEKAREASSFVSQAEQRKGSADPLDYVLDIVNPATYGFAGTDLVGNTAMGVNNLAKGNFSEAAGNALNAGMNALYLLPAKGLAKTIASPMAFTPVEGMMYRGLGKEGFKDAVQSGVFRPKQLNYTSGRSLAERATTPKQFSSTYYAPAKKFGVVENYGPDYLAEVPFNEEDFFRRYSKRNDWSYSTPRQIPINEGRILKKDWLLGYKPVEVSNVGQMSITPPVGGHIKNIANELLGSVRNKGNKAAIAEGNAWLKNWIDDPVTQAKIDTDLGWIPQRGNILKDRFDLGYEQAKSFVPNTKQYPISNQIQDLGKSLFLKNTESHIHSGNQGISHLYGKSPDVRRILEKTNNDPRYGSWITRDIRVPQNKRASITAHEGTHDWTSDFLLDASGQKQDIQSLLPSDIKILTDQFNKLRNQGLSNKKIFNIMGKENAYKGYYGTPTEIHTRIMQLRKALNMTPEQSKNVTTGQAKNIINIIDKAPDQTFVDPKFLNGIDRDPQKLAYLFNRLWAVPPAAAAASQLQEQKQGGQTSWLNKYK